MNALIILGHPNKHSFNHAIADACKTQLEAKGHTVFFHDLYREEFKPIHHLENTNTTNEIKTHCSHLKTCDVLIVIHPNWWGQPPAIVKGWMDRVLIPGVAYDFARNEKGDYIPIGLLHAKVGLVINTSNTPNNSEDDVLDSIWKKNVLNICGINDVKRINFGMIKNSTEYQRIEWLLEVKQLMNSLIPTLK